MDLSQIPAGKNPPHDINVVIEIPAGGLPVKYEMDKASGALFVDRFLHTAMFYPGNYGFVPHTLSEDGDPCDVLVISAVPVIPGAVVRCRPVGALVMQDQAGPDEKIVAVPVDDLHPYHTGVRSYRDLPEILRQQIEHFFQHYKDLEPAKWTRIGEWIDADGAAKLISDGITRAKKRIYIRFASNRRMHGLWQASIPSRFLDELPEAHVDVVEDTSSYGGYGMGGYGSSRFDTRDPFQNTYATPGWERAKRNKGTAGSMGGYGNFSGPKTSQRLIEGELVAKATTSSAYKRGERVFHQKFGYGRISAVEGNKLTVEFEKAGEKRVLDSFVARP